MLIATTTYSRTKVIIKQDIELYHIGQQVYLVGPRGTDINPYTIYQCLGNGQYKIERDGKVVKKPVEQKNLQTNP